MSDKNIDNLKVSELDNSEIEIEGEIPADQFDKAYKASIENAGKNVEIPGFRKGKAPENVVVQHVGESKLLQEAAQSCLAEEYPKVLINNKIDAIGQPQITITKVALGNPLGFKIKTAVMPKVELPSSYKEEAAKEMKKEEKEEEVTEKEVEDVILQVRKNHAQAQSENQKNGGGGGSENLPELNDELVKSLGDFKDVSDFKAKIKENIGQEKKLKQKEKKRLAIIEKLIENSKISLPEIVVEGELQKMLSQFKFDVEKAGLKYEDYLSQIKKTEEEIKKEWREGAVKKAKMQLILNKIAVEEKISPNQKEMEEQVQHILNSNPDADPERVKVYVETHMTNEGVFQFLENQK